MDADFFFNILLFFYFFSLSYNYNAPASLFIIDEIRNKNGRITEILNELKVQEEYFTPTWNDSEFPQRVVEVKDDEIPGKYFKRRSEPRVMEAL